MNLLKLLRVVAAVPAVVLTGAAADQGAGGGRTDIRITDSRGQAVAPLAAMAGKRATVLIFLTPDCPAGNRYAPELARIREDYAARGVVFYAVYAEASAPAVREHLRIWQLPLEGLLDPEQKLAALTGATVTPEACVLSPAGGVLYRGRIDDRGVKLGTFRTEPRQRDLRLALDAVLEGRPVVPRFTKAIGCYLPPRAPSKP